MQLSMNACVPAMCLQSCQLCAILWTAANQALLFMNSKDKNIGVGCHALLQGIFLTWGSN